MSNIKIRIPKKLYESIKQKAALNESEIYYFWKKDKYGFEKCYAKDDENNVWQVDSSKCKRRGTYNGGRDHLNEDNLSPDQLMQVIAGISSLGLGGLAIAKIQDYIKKKNPELYKKLEDTHATMDKAYRGGLDEERGDKGRSRSSKNRFQDKDYAPKTDYRVDQNFYHKEYGKGKIIKVTPVSPIDQSKDGADIYVKFEKTGENKKLHVITLKPDERVK